MRARIFAVWLISFILGSMVAPLFEFASGTYLYLGLAIVICAFLVYAKRYVFGILLGLGLFLLAVSLFQTREVNLVRQNDNLTGKSVQIVGYIADVPVANEFGQSVALTTTMIDGKESVVKLKAYFGKYPAMRYGQTVIFTGKLKPYADKKWRLAKDGYVGEINIGDYSLTATEPGTWIIIKGWLFSARSAFNGAIQKSLPSAEAGLASGLILGEKALITPEVTRQLQISGTTHIIALSGYNVTIILGLFLLLRGKLSRLMNIIVPIGFIIAFTIMTGGAASLVRAAIMGFMPLLASYLGREGDSFMAILFSAAIMIAFNPFLALFDVGFQLSFAALAGMIYLAPIITKLLSRLPKYLSGPFSETVGAQLAAMPLLAYYFGSVSLVSPFANLVILSLVPLGMMVAFVVGLAGMIWQAAANLVAIPSYVILHGINSLIAFFGSLPAASKSVKIENPIWMLLMYFVLFDLWLITHRFRSQVSLPDGE